ncbi:recombinase family protein [Candidatus Gracilibacteria bacterium]|nr:recombinase family protein [Candidatus Gracilibacteria bacterium]
MEETKKPLKAYGYLRVSSEEQAKTGNGINGQRTSIKLEAERRGIDIVEFYEDGGVSGKYQSREALDRMLDDLKKANKKEKTIDFVMTDDIDRIARDIDVWRFVKTAIKATKAKIYSLKQDLQDSPENQMFETIVMSVKQYERENGARRVKDRQRARMLDGFRVFHVPLGYKYAEAEDKRGKIVVADPDSFPVIKEGLSLLAKGILPNKAQLHKFFQRSGIKSKGGNKIYKSFVDHMLRKENLVFYAGIIDYAPRDLHMIKAKHPAAIDEATFYKLVAKFKIKGFYKTYTESFINEKLPLRQILICNHCGAKMTGNPSKGNGGMYFYYMCDNPACEYRKKSINGDKVHNAIEGFLQSLTMDDRYMKAFEVVIKHFWNHKQEIKQSLYQQKQQSVDEAKNKIDLLVKKCLTATSPALIDGYEKEILSLEDTKRSFEFELATATDIAQEDNFVEHFNRLKAIIQAPIGIWNMGQIDLKRMLINTLFERTLSYSKDVGIQTKKMPVIYSIFSKNGEKNMPYWLKCLYENLLISKNLHAVQTAGKSFINYALNNNFLMVGDIGLEPMTPCL